MVFSHVSYEPGAVVCEPFLGLCEIVNTSEETMLGVQQAFYELKPRRGNAVLKVPASQMSARGIRPLMTPEQVETALDARESAPFEAVEEDYTQRSSRWTQLLRSGQAAGAYSFLREWNHLSAQGVRLSLKESEMYENVQRTVAQEIAQVLQISLNKARQRLSSWTKVEKPGEKKKKANS